MQARPAGAHGHQMLRFCKGRWRARPRLAYHFRTEQAAVVNAGAVPLIMTALREHADDADVQCIGFKAVARLLDISEDDDDNWVDVPFSPDSRVQLPASDRAGARAETQSSAASRAA